jgi:hypothetical protein
VTIPSRQHRIPATPIPHDAESPARASTGFCYGVHKHDRISLSDRLPRLFAVGGFFGGVPV